MGHIPIRAGKMFYYCNNELLQCSSQGNVAEYLPGSTKTIAPPSEKKCKPSPAAQVDSLRAGA